MIIQLACKKVFGSFVMSNRRTVSDKLRRLLTVFLATYFAVMPIFSNACSMGKF